MVIIERVSAVLDVSEVITEGGQSVFYPRYF